MGDNRRANQPNAERQSSWEPDKRERRSECYPNSRCSTKLKKKKIENNWSIEDFSAQQQTLKPEEYIMSPSFGDKDYKFSFVLFPNGKDQEHSEYVSLYLHVNKCPNKRLRFLIRLTINTLEGPKTCSLNKNVKKIEGWSINLASKFFLLRTINESRNLFTPNDVLTLGCELTVYGDSLTWTTYDSPSIERGEADREKATKDDYGKLPTWTTGGYYLCIIKRRHACTVGEEAPNGDRLPSLLDSGDFSDFTIVASCGREFNTHMCILSSRSDYFQTLLRNKTTREFFEKRVIFEDISAETLEVILRHIYNPIGENTIEDHHLTIDLAAAVDRLMVPSMRTAIKEMLSLNLLDDNIATRITMAVELGLEDEYEYLLEVFAGNKEKAMESAEWLMLTEERHWITAKILEECAMILDEKSGEIVSRITVPITVD